MRDGQPEVQLADVVKSYKELDAVDHVTLDIRKGEFFSLLGPSGCGKTTTLRLVAGFIAPTVGRIMIQGEDVTHQPPEKRNVGIVFQNYAIFPHMNAYDNIAFGLRLRKMPKDVVRRKVGEMLDRVGLKGFEHKFQRQLSGGEQQRVALARVLVTQPRILLLDEPLSALDKKLREEMKFWIKDLQHQLGITTIYVTHDQSEALTMSDRLAVMHRGRVEQVGTPREVYELPASHFVTDFIGESNILPAQILRVGPQIVDLLIHGFEVRAPRTQDFAGQPNEPASVVVRPENILVGIEEENGSVNRLRGRLVRETYQGSLIRYHVQVGEHTIVAELPNTVRRKEFQIDEEVSVGWHPQSSTLIMR